MALLTVLEYPHKALRTPASPVVLFDDHLLTIVKNMIETMYHDKGVGLAANQVGILSQIIVMDTSKEENAPICLINPQIISQEGEIFYEEGCLSLPGIYPKVKRAVTVTIEYQDEFGQPHTFNADGLMAHCIQHEMDHLNGILAIDHLSSLKRALIIKKLEKQQRKAG
jgi:peptide deformylase